MTSLFGNFRSGPPIVLALALLYWEESARWAKIDSVTVSDLVADLVVLDILLLMPPSDTNSRRVFSIERLSTLPIS